MEGIYYIVRIFVIVGLFHSLYKYSKTGEIKWLIWATLWASIG